MPTGMSCFLPHIPPRDQVKSSLTWVMVFSMSNATPEMVVSRIAPPEDPVADLVALGHAEHELAGGVRLAVGGALEVVALVDGRDHVLEPVAAGPDGGVAHPHQRLVAEGVGAGVAGRLHPERPRRLLAVQESLEHAVLDDGDVAARGALVVDVDGDARVAVRPAPGVVDEGELLRRHLSSEIVARHRAAEHEVRLAGVPDGLVGEDPGEVGVQDDVVGSGLAVRAVRLLPQLFVEPVDGLEHPVDALEPILEVSESPVDLVEVHHTVVALHCEPQHEVRARHVGARGRAFGGDERLLDGEVREHDVGVEETGIGAGHVVVDLGDDRHAVGRGRLRSPGAIVELAASGPGLGQGARVRAAVPGQLGVGRCLGDDGFDGTVAVADPGGETERAAAMAPGGDAALLDPRVVDEDALAHHEPRLHVGVRAQFRVAVEVLGVLQQRVEHGGSPGAAGRRGRAVNVPAPAEQECTAVAVWPWTSRCLGVRAGPHSCSVKVVWIPACAGMTEEGLRADAVRTIIPAFAGMTVQTQLMSFPRRRESMGFRTNSLRKRVHRSRMGRGGGAAACPDSRQLSGCASPCSGVPRRRSPAIRRTRAPRRWSRESGG